MVPPGCHREPDRFGAVASRRRLGARNRLGNVRGAGRKLGARAAINMRLHGGDITLAETGSHGTRFRLNLPAH